MTTVPKMRLTSLLLNLFCAFYCFADDQKYCDPNHYNVSNWTCEEHKYWFSLQNLQKTLYCIGFDGSVFASKALNRSDPSKFEATRKVNRILKLDVETTDLVFDETFGIFYYDERLNFHKNDCLSDIEYSGAASAYFAPMLLYHMAGIRLSDIQVFELYRKHFQGKDVRGWVGAIGHRVVKMPCDVDLRRYPFDSQICEVKMVFKGN